MTGTRKIFLDESYFSSMDTAPTSVNVIIINPLLYDVSHDGTVQGYETISLQGVNKTEVAYTSRDSAPNIGKYCFNPADNTLCLLVDPAVVTTDALAKSYITGILIDYEMIDLEFYSTEPQYILNTKYSSGADVGSTTPVTFDIIQARIEALDNGIDVNVNGYYIHTLTRALTAA